MQDYMAVKDAKDKVKLLTLNRDHDEDGIYG